MKRILPSTIFIAVTLFSLLGCGQNILESFSKVSDESLLVDARIHMDKYEWDLAIAKFTDMSAEFLATREIKFLHASAYAGKCGLDFMDFIEKLTSIGTEKLYAFLMGSFLGVTSAIESDACIQAEVLIKSISSSASDRTVNENTFMAFIGFTKIGVILSRYADTDDDGSADAGFNSCSTVSIPDSDVKQIATGLAIALTSLAAPGVSLGEGQVTDLNSICGELTGLGPTYDFCSDTETTSITGDKLKAARTIIGEGQVVGIGSCAASPDSVSNCTCP